MKKRYISFLMLVVMTFGLMGCGSRLPVNPSGKLIKVGIVNNSPDESGYRTANDLDIRSKFTESNGYEAHFAYGSRNEEQIEAAQGFIQDGVEYLLLSAADTSGWKVVMKQARDAGVKVILFDRTIDVDESFYEVSVISDMEQEGQTAVDWLAGQGFSDYKIVHIQGVMGSAAQQGRSSALEKRISMEQNWTIVEQQTANWSSSEAKEIVKAVIDDGKQFNVIYAENDDMAKGAVEALDEAGISHGVGQDVCIMGFDCNRWALEELLAKRWNYDGQCNPFQASYLDEIIKTLESGGRLADKTIILNEKGFDATTITEEDIIRYGI